ncbi:MAG: REDY-like protein HapK [Rhodothermia bacterium]|nr:REDY-like protein HapK [Rhodothermia bacterium]
MKKTTLIVLFNLKEGVSEAEYEQFAQEIDVPTVVRLNAVESFKVFRTSGVLGSEAPAPYRYVEVIEVADLDGLFGELGTETMQRVAGQFQAFAENPVFIMADAFAG